MSKCIKSINVRITSIKNAESIVLYYDWDELTSINFNLKERPKYMFDFVLKIEFISLNYEKFQVPETSMGHFKVI